MTIRIQFTHPDQTRIGQGHRNRTIFQKQSFDWLNVLIQMKRNHYDFSLDHFHNRITTATCGRQQKAGFRNYSFTRQHGWRNLIPLCTSPIVKPVPPV